MARLNKRESAQDEGKPVVEVYAEGENPLGDPINLVESDGDLDAAEDVDEETDETLELDADEEVEEKLVAIRPRRTVMHTRIGTVWYNFVEGREVMVPVSVRDWLYEKKVL